MPVDFDKLVLLPGQDTFGIPITVDPVKSQPMAPPYSARAVITSRGYEVMIGEGVGAGLSDQQTSLSIRLSEFKVPPVARDIITVQGRRYTAGDIVLDDQGAATIPLRLIEPNYDG